MVSDANSRTPLLAFKEHKNKKSRKDGEDEEDEQNDVTIRKKSTSQRNIRYNGITSLIKINLIFGKKTKEEAKLSPNTSLISIMQKILNYSLFL